jgi:peroxiredoxin
MVMGDSDAHVSRTYQAHNETSKTNSRHLYVIDKTGRVTYKTLPFRVTVQDAYDELGKEIDKLNPPPTPPGGTP